MKSYHLNELIYVTIFPLKINLFFFVVTLIRLLFLAVFLSTDILTRLEEINTQKSNHLEKENVSQPMLFVYYSLHN